MSEAVTAQHGKQALHYRGRIRQTFIYLGKLLRMFVYQSDWKALPMAAVIAGLVTFAVGSNLFKTQEGTLQGCFALACVCVWNGFFNSIQVICRERPIIKREHRAGMHISSYIAAHMIYQVLLCSAQTGITIGVCQLMGVQFPKEGLITGSFKADFAITLFLGTYAADMTALMISALVKTTTTAMTVMPFMLIFQLLFSGGLVELSGPVQRITDITIAKWSLNGLCTLGNFNAQPMVKLWNTLYQFREMEFQGVKPVTVMMNEIQSQNRMDEVLLRCGEYNQKAEFVYTAANLGDCWKHLIVMALVMAVIATVLLEFVDKDKR